MSTLVNYNGIRLVDVLTKSVDQEAMFDDHGVDQVGIKTTVSIEGYVRVAESPEGERGGMTVPSMELGFELVHSRLSQPRRRFLMTIGGATIFDVGPAAVRPLAPVTPVLPGQGGDIDHGPKTRVRIGEITGTKSFKVALSVTFVLLKCDGTTHPGNPGGIVNLRWWISEQQDLEWLTTRTYTGSFRVASHAFNPHYTLRNHLVLPPLAPGFQRQRIAVSERPDGITMDFAVTDKEIPSAPPYPAIQWKGRHTISAVKQGHLARSNCSIALTGAKYTDHRVLFNLAMRIVDQRIDLIARIRQALLPSGSEDREEINGAFLEDLRFSDEFTGNRVEVSATIRHSAAARNLLGLMDTDLGKPINLTIPGTYFYSREISQPMVQSATLVGIFRGALQDGCHPAVGSLAYLSSGNRMAGGNHIVGNNEQEGDLTLEEPLNRGDSYVAERYQSEPYLYSDQSSTYDRDSGKHVLPIANTNGAVAGKVIQFTRARQYRYVEYRAGRLNSWPDIPKPQDFDGHTIIGEPFIAPRTPKRSADGISTLYEVDAQYDFLVDDPDALPVQVGRDLTRGSAYTPGGDNVEEIPGSAWIDPGTPESPL